MSKVRFEAGMNTDAVRIMMENGNYRNDSAKATAIDKAILRFNKADKDQDGYLSEEEVKSYRKKQTWKTAGLIAGGVALVGLSAFAVTKFIQTRNLKKLGELIGENKAGLKVYKRVGPGGEEVLTTIDGKTGEVIKKISKRPNPEPWPWMIDNDLVRMGKVSDAKSYITHIDDFKTGESIDRVSGFWQKGIYKNTRVETVRTKAGKIEELSTLWIEKQNTASSIEYMMLEKGMPGQEVTHTEWIYGQFPNPVLYVDKEMTFTDKYLRKMFNLS